MLEPLTVVDVCDFIEEMSRSANNIARKNYVGSGPGSVKLRARKLAGRRKKTSVRKMAYRRQVRARNTDQMTKMCGTVRVRCCVQLNASVPKQLLRLEV